MYDCVVVTVVSHFSPGHIEPMSNLEPSFTDQGFSNTEWVVLDTVSHVQMGQPLRRLKEMVLFAEYR